MKTIILHGWGEDKTYWRHIVDKLGSDFEVEAFDLPGFGTESKISDDTTVEDYAEWVTAKIQKLKYRDVVLLGYSFGGRIVSKIAAKRPEWLKGLILYAAPSIYRPEQKTQIKIRTYKALKNLFPNQLKQKFYSEDLKDAENRGLGQVFRNVVQDDQTETLPQINVPTYLLWGDQDISVRPEIGREINQLIPNSKFEILPDVGHHAHLDNSNLFYGRLKKVLENFS